MPFENDGIRWYSDVHWGIHGCRLLLDEEGARCRRPAELLVCIDDREKGVPACIECVDHVLEYNELVARDPRARERLGTLHAEW